MHLLALLVPLASAEILGSWTISALSRQCIPSNTACTYTLSLTTPLSPDPANQQEQQQQQHTCTFTITSTDPANQPATHTDFTGIPCHNTNPNTNPNNAHSDNAQNDNTAPYTLNGGWDPHGTFLTLVPTDTARGRCAFFGYGEAELAGGAVAGLRRAAVYRVGEVDSNSGGGGGGGAAAAARGLLIRRGLVGGGVERVGKRGGAEEGGEWQIKGLTRFADMGANTTTWQFTIVHAGGRETHCSPTAPTSDPVGSFYGLPCGINDDADFKASWGYNSDADSAVMTLCYVPHGTDAWFGYEQVSHNQWLGDSKKEPVHYTGCG
ncbi:hypothetical protein B0I37DRAFT_410390 [Chaetomium sp. MPI-CAGE-AT-0009]|nr:hypothetical protein B0I37DRAFT_410390 [Chaetomium sp. MPI-CAGE-AT-0009]